MLTRSFIAIDFYGTTGGGGGGGYLTGGSPFGSNSGSPGGIGRVRFHRMDHSHHLTFSAEGRAFTVLATYYRETVFPSNPSSCGCGMGFRKFRLRTSALSSRIYEYILLVRLTR